MIKKLLKTSLMLGLFTASTVFAQLPDGSIAPNFIYTDINGVSQNLYNYLNAGKTVYLDVSATWCGPCWDYHSGAIKGGDNIVKYVKVTSSTSAGVSSYTSAPVVSLVGGNGTGATAQAVLTNGVVTKIEITNNGSSYTASPSVIIGTPWAASTTLTAGDQLFAGNNLYTVVTGGTTSTLTPTHVSTYEGALWTASTTLTTGTQVYYGNNLYVVSVAGVTGTDPVTHTSGSYVDGTATLDYVGQTGPEQNNGTAVLKYAGIAAKANIPAAAIGKEAALHELWRKHGPTGQTGVEASSTNEIIVLFLEAQTTNTINQLYGVNAGSTYATNTKGDWVSGTAYPIIDLPNNTFNNNYNIAYFPTLYMICPNRTITEVGQLNYSDLYDARLVCPAPASAPTDAALLELNKNTKETCSSAPLQVVLQNNGTSPLTSCNFEVKTGGSQVATYAWAGNLATYATQVVTLTSVTPTANTIYDINITTSDADASNNSQSFEIKKAPKATKKNIKIEVATDKWGNETTWKLFNNANAVVASGGPYTTYTTNGPHVETPYEADLADDCYRFEIYDAYGDGIAYAGGGNGYYRIYADGIKIFEKLDFTSDKDAKFFEVAHEEDVTGITHLNLNNNVLIYPNPVSNTAEVSFELKKAEQVSINIQNLLGQTVYNKSLGIVEKGINSQSIDVTNVPNGLYIVTVEKGTEKTTKKITINK